ncbi:MAG: endo-1,4-beta-xylanase, partial [Phycisphaerae bacterium]|nr:endo-1,4-beta-xylanase [Phycisphaerae bacterium]
MNHDEAGLCRRAVYDGSRWIAGALLMLLVTCATAAGESKFLGSIWKTHWSAPPEGFETLFTQITPENAGKWGSAEETRGRINWAPLDKMYVWAERNDGLTKQHTFVWGQQQPSWTEKFS